MPSQDSHPDLMTRLFDIRIIIAMLLGIFGVVLLLMGIFDTTSTERRDAGDVNVNLWTGLALALVAAGFMIWAWRKPQELSD